MSNKGTGITVGSSSSGGGSGNITIGTSTITSGTNTRVLFDDSGVIGESAGLTYVKGTGTLSATNIVAATGLTNTALTAGRVTFAGTAGLLSDDADLTFSADTLTATKVTTGQINASGGAAGAVLFNSTGNLQFGGATSAFPSLIRNGIILNVNLADNSNNTSLKVGPGNTGVNAALIVGTIGGIDGDGASGLAATNTTDTAFINFKALDFKSGNAALTAATMAVENASLIRSSISSYTWTNAQVTALPTTAGDITVCTLPAKTMIRNAYIVITGAAVGPATVTVSLGDAIGGTPFINLVAVSDAKAAANTIYGDTSAERGTSIDTEFYYVPSYTATTLISAHFISTVANLSTVTGSTGRIILETILLP